jgi:predicted secreted protein
MDEDDRLELVREIFAQLTMMFEDASKPALAGQSKTTSKDRLIELAEAVGEQARRADLLARAVPAILN